MWRPEHRSRDDRGALRYPSDPTDAEWASIGPVDPLCGATPPVKRGGNKRAVDARGRCGGVAGGGGAKPPRARGFAPHAPQDICPRKLAKWAGIAARK